MSDRDDEILRNYDLRVAQTNREIATRKRWFILISVVLFIIATVGLLALPAYLLWRGLQ